MKLGDKQIELLRKTCQTNGGGVSVWNCDRRVMRSLEAKGLIQGKLNQESWFVHTREGLKLYRELAKREGGE